MKAQELNTAKDSIRLVEPEIERDAQKGMEWLQGGVGKHTLSLMGVPENAIDEPDIESEKERVKGFIENEDQLNWMIEREGEVVGSVWVDLEPSENLKAPSVHIMIGDKNTRGQGIGHASIEAVLAFLHERGHSTIFSRHLSANAPATELLNSFEFINDGDGYTDKDGLKWQNVALIAPKTD